MNLKHDVLVSNKFASKYHLTAHQGKTPGRFVTNYAARPSATEPLFMSDLRENKRFQRMVMLTSMKRSRYKNPKSHNFGDPRQLSKRLFSYYGLDGRAFSSNHITLTQKQLYNGSHLIQQCFNHGHSVQKLVISFALPYLKKRGLVDKDFKMIKRGSSFGQVDQLKARTAITNGLNAMVLNANYKNPYWIAAIQFDTRHVHCHVVATDTCPLTKSNRLVPYRRQGSDVHYRHLEDKGKITQQDKNVFRNEADFSLQEMYPLGVFHSQPSVNRQNVLSQVSYLTSNQFNVNSYLQELVESLPKNRKLWNYNNRSHLMRHPNHLMHSYIGSLIHYHDHYVGYNRTLAVIKDKSSRGNYSKDEQETRYRNGVANLDSDMANTVYGQLKSISPSKIHIKTLFLNNHAYDMQDVQRIIRSGYQGHKIKHINSLMAMYRLSSYEDRYANSMRGFVGYSRALDDYNDRSYDNLVVPESKPLRSYYLEFKLYNARKIDKYRYILPDRDFVDLGTEERMKKKRHKLFEWYLHLKNRKDLGSQMTRDVHYLPMNRARQFIHSDNPEVKQLLAYKGHDWPANLKHTIAGLINHRNRRIPTPIKKTLPLIESAYPQFDGISYELNNRTRTETSVYVDPSPAKYEYARALGKFTDDAFIGRLITSNQLVDRTQLWQSNSLIAPPKLRVPSVRNKSFQRVKGVDMQDCVYDFNPGESRYLSPNTCGEFRQSTNNLNNTLDLVAPYIKHAYYSHDVSKEQYRLVQNLRTEFRQATKMSDMVNDTHVMPIGRTMKKINNYHHERNLSTIAIPVAHQYARQHVLDLSQSNQSFIQELDDEPDKVLEAPESQEQSSKNAEKIDNSHENGYEPSDGNIDASKQNTIEPQ